MRLLLRAQGSEDLIPLPNVSGRILSKASLDLRTMHPNPARPLAIVPRR